MKGALLEQFKIGGKVYYPRGIDKVSSGNIVKLHKSGKSGTAEIKDSKTGVKVTRKLCFISKVLVAILLMCSTAFAGQSDARKEKIENQLKVINLDLEIMVLKHAVNVQKNITLALEHKQKAAQKKQLLKRLKNIEKKEKKKAEIVKQHLEDASQAVLEKPAKEVVIKVGDKDLKDVKIEEIKTKKEEEKEYGKSTGK